MKIIIILFSCFILYLSVVPCCIDSGCVKTNNIQSSAKLIEHNHEDTKHFEICSPFCLCSCCGSHVVNTAIASTVIPILSLEQNETNINLYTFQGTSKFEATIWQPPQIG